MLTAHSVEIGDFIDAMERNRNQRPGDRPVRFEVKERRLYLAIDEVDGGGRFLVDRFSGDVYGIEGYGKRGRRLGHIEALTERFNNATSEHPYQGGKSYSANHAHAVPVQHMGGAPSAQPHPTPEVPFHKVGSRSRRGILAEGGYTPGPVLAGGPFRRKRVSWWLRDRSRRDRRQGR